MIISLLSGKGGVGKTTIVANLGATLASLNKKVLMIDLNISTPSLGLYLGLLSQEKSIQKALKGEMDVRKCIYSHPSGFHVLLADFYNEECDMSFLRETLETLQFYDFIILDGAAGIGKEVKATIRASDKILIVVNPLMFSIVAGVKILRIAKKENKEVEVIVNKYGMGPKYITLKKIREMLDAPIISVIPFDKRVIKSCERNELIVLRYPDSRVSESFREMGSKLVGIPMERKGIFSKVLLKLRRLFG